MPKTTRADSERYSQVRHSAVIGMNFQVPFFVWFFPSSWLGMRNISSIRMKFVFLQAKVPYNIYFRFFIIHYLTLHPLPQVARLPTPSTASHNGSPKGRLRRVGFPRRGAAADPPPPPPCVEERTRKRRRRRKSAAKRSWSGAGTGGR